MGVQYFCAAFNFPEGKRGQEWDEVNENWKTHWKM